MRPGRIVAGGRKRRQRRRKEECLGSMTYLQSEDLGDSSQGIAKERDSGKEELGRDLAEAGSTQV